MSKHTPGPWITQWNSGCIDVLRLYEDGSFSRIPHAKVIDDFAVNKIRILANASLIAAAPELLEVLQEVFADHDAVNRLSWNDRAAAALAKTGGKE